MFCSNCGAELKESDVTCPYCGMLQPSAAESEYMQKLEHLKQDVQNLKAVPTKEYTRELRYQRIFTAKIVLIIFCIFLLLFVIGISVFYGSSYLEKKELRKENAFAKEYFPKLNELYASGNDEEVYTYINSLYNLDGSTALYRWKHMDYYNYYTLYMDVKFLNDAIADNSYNEYDISTGFYSAMVLTREEFSSYHKNKLTDAELVKLDTFIQESDSLLLEHFHLTSDEADQVYQDCLDDGYLSYKKCMDYTASHKNQFS